MDILTTSVRDKLIICAMIIFGAGCLAGIFLGKSLEPILGMIITGLFGIYKGNPSVPSPTTSSSETQTTKTETTAVIAPVEPKA